MLWQVSGFHVCVVAGNILQIRVGMYVIPVGTESVRSVLINIMALMAVDINAANVLGDV